MSDYLDLFMAMGFVGLLLVLVTAFVLVAAAGLDSIPFRNTTVLRYFIERIGLHPEQ